MSSITASRRAHLFGRGAARSDCRNGTQLFQHHPRRIWLMRSASLPTFVIVTGVARTLLNHGRPVAVAPSSYVPPVSILGRARNFLDKYGWRQGESNELDRRSRSICTSAYSPNMIWLASAFAAFNVAKPERG